MSFEVTGHNGLVVGSDLTNGAGEASFTYTVDQVPDSLGDDTISASITVGDQTQTIEFTKTWVDTTPPTASCDQGPNPGGNIPQAPGEGEQGQNQDGFYTLDASDAVWPDDLVGVFVTDSGSGTVFGPFDPGDNIHYTQNESEPRQRNGPGAVDYRLNGTGDAVLTAVDGSGNTSDPVDCLVPRPPL